MLLENAKNEVLKNLYNKVGKNTCGQNVYQLLHVYGFDFEKKINAVYFNSVITVNKLKKIINDVKNKNIMLFLVDFEDGYYLKNINKYYMFTLNNDFTKFINCEYPGYFEGLNSFYNISKLEEARKKSVKTAIIYQEKSDIKERFKPDLKTERVKIINKHIVKYSYGKDFYINSIDYEFKNYNMRNTLVNVDYYSSPQKIKEITNKDLNYFFDKSGYYKRNMIESLKVKAHTLKIEKEKSAFLNYNSFDDDFKNLNRKKNNIINQAKQLINNALNDLNIEKIETIEYINGRLKTFIHKYNNFDKKIKNNNFENLEVYKKSLDILVNYELICIYKFTEKETKKAIIYKTYCDNKFISLSNYVERILKENNENIGDDELWKARREKEKNYIIDVLYN